MIQLILAYLFLLAFFLLEPLLRKNGMAKSIENKKEDHRSTQFIGITFLVTVIASIILNIFKLGSFHRVSISIFGLAMMIAGLALRIWSMTTLSSYYTRTLVTTDSQSLITKGPYKFIRHPGYLGTLLIWIGSGLAMQNSWLFVLCLIMFTVSYAYRIANEERMLRAQFENEFSEYAKHSWKLIPLIW